MEFPPPMYLAGFVLRLSHFHVHNFQAICPLFFGTLHFVLNDTNNGLPCQVVIQNQVPLKIIIYPENRFHIFRLANQVVKHKLPPTNFPIAFPG